MHPYIIILKATIHGNADRKNKVLHVDKKPKKKRNVLSFVERKWYKIDKSYFLEYKRRYFERAEKKYGDNIFYTMQYKQKMSRKEWKKERKENPLMCEQ